MKKIIFLIVFIYSFKSYSQEEINNLQYIVNKTQKERNYDELNNKYFSKLELEEEYLTESNRFKSLAKPDESSDLSNFIRANLNPKLIENIDFNKIRSFYNDQNIPKKIFNNTIRLTFEIDENNKARNCIISTGNYDLNKQIKEIFKKYPLEKLSIDESSKSGKISIQLFAYENKKTIIKASAFAVIDQIPIQKNCTDIKYYQQLSSCLYKNLYNYILPNISLATISKQNLRGEIKIRPRFSIDTNGKVFHVNSIAPNKIIKDEIDRIIKSYNEIIIPAKRNNEPKIFFYDTDYVIIID